jgi:hypothetical protein
MEKAKSQRIIAGNSGFTGKPGVDVHGEVESCFTPFGHGLDITSIVPGHEDLIGARSVAKHLRPGAGTLLTLLQPERAKFGIDGVAMGLDVYSIS